MTTPTLIDASKGLAQAVAEFDPPPYYPLNASPWIAMALLQKAIRRGRKQCALRAAATLLHQSPERLWRRIGCIAFEDVGVGDIEAVDWPHLGCHAGALYPRRGVVHRERRGSPALAVKYVYCLEKSASETRNNAPPAGKVCCVPGQTRDHSRITRGSRGDPAQSLLPG